MNSIKVYSFCNFADDLNSAYTTTIYKKESKFNKIDSQDCNCYVRKIRQR